MSSIGNDVSNEFYLCLLGAERAAIEKPGPRADRATKEGWIKKKYVDKTYVLPEEVAAANQVIPAG